MLLVPGDTYLSIYRCIIFIGFLGGSDGKAFAGSAGDPGLISGSGRSSGEGTGYQLGILDWRIPWIEEPGRFFFLIYMYIHMCV